MMSMESAMKAARKLPEPSIGMELKLRVEVLCAYMKLHDLRKVGWRGDLLVLTPIDPPPVLRTSPQMKSTFGGRTASDRKRG